MNVQKIIEDNKKAAKILGGARFYSEQDAMKIISNDIILSKINEIDHDNLISKTIEFMNKKKKNVAEEVINSYIGKAKEVLMKELQNVEPSIAEAVEENTNKVIDYLLECARSKVNPEILLSKFDTLSAEDIGKAFADPDFDVKAFLSIDAETPEPTSYEVAAENAAKVAEIISAKPDTEVINKDGSVALPATEEVVEKTSEEVEETTNEIPEEVKAAKDPIRPIAVELPNGQVDIDMSAAVKTPTAAQEPIRPTEQPKSKKKDKKAPKMVETCADPNCACHTNDGIQWPLNIAAYFDTSSLFMVKDKNMKKSIGERIARAFDSFDTLQEIAKYLGDAPENPFNFKLTSVKNVNEFTLTTDRTINGKYTKLVFNFMAVGATITAA